MATVVTQLFEWCSSDFKVLRRSVKIALNHLQEKMEKLNHKKWKLCDVSCCCIDYDVSSLSVSIHLPLSRAIAGLLLELSKHNVDYASLDPPLSLIELMEMPLRTLVMISQFRASMWRRNGFSLVNQISVYHGPSFREEMFDKDIIMMQYAASQIDPDKYLIHLLNKFNLMFWVQENYESNQSKQDEDFIRQTSVLVEEFFNLLLIIVSDRHTPGVSKCTPEDKIRKEIVQWLCIEPCTHSDLCKNLSKPSKDVQIERLIDEMAVFKKHRDNQSGKYELREQFYKDFNPFFYHYTRVEQCSAEESQLKRKRQNGERFIACTPPVPPELTEQFKPLRNILVCRVFLHIVKVVLERVCDESKRSFSENQYEKTLHLIGVALYEEKRDLEKSEIKMEEKFSFTKAAEQNDLLTLLKRCAQSARVESHKNLTNWLLQLFKDTVEARNGKPADENDPEKCMESEPAAGKRSSMAAVLREKIMAQMSAMQNKFIEKNSEYFQDDKDEGEEMNMNASPQEQLTYVDLDPIALGNEQRGKYTPFESYFCMLCRENEDLTNTSSCMVMAAFAQKSTVLSKNRSRKIPICSRKKKEEPPPPPQQPQQLTMPADLHCGTHVSTCGHVMHLECWTQFFDSVVSKERRRPIRYGRHGSFNVDMNEYLCPLCECLSNTVVPVIANTFYRNTLRSNRNSPLKISMNDWLSVMFNLVSNSKLICENYGSITKRKVKLDSLVKLMENLSLNDDARDAFTALEELYTENATKERNFDMRLITSIKKLSKSISLVETGREVDDLDARASLFSHWSCSFTMQSLEKLLREEFKPVFGDLSSRKHSCLQVLVRYCAVNSVIYDFNSIRNHCIDLFHYLLISEKYILNPSSILDVDAFSILISLILTSASLFVKDDREEADRFKTKSCLTLPLGNVVDQYLVQLMMLFHIVQIILTQNELYEQVPMELDEQPSATTPTGAKEVMNSESRSIAMFYVDILKIAGIKSAYVNSISNSLADSIAVMLRSKLLPFLRCTALFYHYLTEIMPPKKLSEEFFQSADASCSIQDIEEREFVILCEYLALPKKLSELFSNVSLVSLAQMWARHPRISIIFEENEKLNRKATPKPLSLLVAGHLATAGSPEEPHESTSYLPFKLIKQPHSTNQLIDLPEDYTELINSVALMPCASSDAYADARNPTLCLVCGTMLFSNGFSNQRELDGESYGNCCYHAFECGAGVGIFLTTNDCNIMLLAGKTKGGHLSAFWEYRISNSSMGSASGNFSGSFILDSMDCSLQSLVCARNANKPSSLSQDVS